MISIDAILHWLGNQDPQELKSRLATKEGVLPELSRMADLEEGLGEDEVPVDSQESADAATMGAQDQGGASGVWSRLSEAEKEKLGKQVLYHSETLGREELDSLLT